jgi:hypothetical protein
MDANSPGVISAQGVTLVVLWGLILVLLALSHRPPARAVPVSAKVPRPLKPKTGDDCPMCQGTPTAKTEAGVRRMPRPWCEVRSTRGPKKHADTEGYACDHVSCEDYGIADATVHALIAYGGHGKHERIPDLYCQACKHKVTVRRYTVLYRLKTPSARGAEALTFLAEGVDVSVLERTWCIGEGALRTWLTRAGLHAAKLHDHFFQGLEFQHIQLDELWANGRQKSREVWVWTTMDVTTKIVPVIRLGPRTLAMAYAVVHELRHRMETGHPLPVFTTDGLRLYFYALTAHFGHWITPAGSRQRAWQIAADFIYGQVKKVQRRRRLIKVELHMLWGEWSLLRSRLQAVGLTGRLNTAFIERLNLTSPMAGRARLC